MADEQVAAILRALAELVPGERALEVLDVNLAERRIVWLGDDTDLTSVLIDPPPVAPGGPELAPPPPPPAFVARSNLVESIRGARVR